MIMKTYGLIGRTLGHSFSRQFFSEKFSSEGIDAEYLNFELPEIDDLSKVFEGRDICGLNVTIPYKQDVIPFLSELSEDAREIGAVNVIKPIHVHSGNNKDNQSVILKGYNTDVIGFMESIRPLLKPHHRNALVLGTGGASRAICSGLKKLGLEVQSVSRTRTLGILSYADLTPTVMGEYSVIVNTTPLGTTPNIDTCADVPYDCITERHLLFDLVYNPSETLFLRKGREHGAQTKNGLEMLHLQAIAAWKIWNE